MSAKSRFLNSVSGIALTAALTTFGLPALADTDSLIGTVLSGLNQNTVGNSAVSVEAESGDPSNAVTVTGTVFSELASSHLNAIGAEITGWDIEASGAFDADSGQNASAFSLNSVSVAGSILGTVLNPDFAPGTGSYGVLVADDIQAQDAWAEAGDFNDGSFSQYNVNITATAQNTIAATGGVVGSSTDSYGVRVDGDVNAIFAGALIDVDNFNGPDNQASGNAQALNLIGVTGAVGGEGPSDGSVGFYVAGSIYAQNAQIDGNDYLYIPVINYGANLSSILSTGVAVLNVEATNSIAVAGTVGVDGSLTNSGGADATGVYVAADVFAEGAFAGGEALGYGDLAALSQGSATAVARNLLTISGTAAGPTGDGTGIEVVGSIYASDAIAVGEGIGRFGTGYGEGGGEQTVGAATAIASNVVAIAGLASSQDGTGVAVGEDVFASNAAAIALAGANPYDYGFEFDTAATALAQAANSIAISGTANANGAVGVIIGDEVYASNALAEGIAVAYANYELEVDGPDPAAIQAGATVTATASNAVAIVGVVGASISGAYGVDPVTVLATNADAYGDATAAVNSIDGLGATADAANSIAASNAIGLGAALGAGVSESTGVYVDQYVEAYNSDAEGGAYASASQWNTDTTAATGATATAANDVQAHNAVAISAALDNSVSNSTGLYVGTYIAADNAWADGAAVSSATVDGGGAADALAQANGVVVASNVVAIGVSIGEAATGVAGVSAGEGAFADYAEARGFVEATAVNDGSEAGNATAEAQGAVQAINTIVASVAIGDDAVDSVGLRAGGWVEAYSSYAEGGTDADAGVFGDSDSTGEALATSVNAVVAVNQAVATAEFGASENVRGLDIAGVGAFEAEAYGYADAYASLYGGVANDTTAEADGNVAASNQAVVQGILLGNDQGSAAAWLSEGVGATEAFAEGAAYAYASAGGNSGNVIGTANGTVSAANEAVAAGIVGANSSESTGVYVGAGVFAGDAVAEGSVSAYAYTDIGDSLGNADATAVGDAVALNAVQIIGTAGTLGNGNTGVFVAGTYSYSAGQVIGSLDVGAGAAYAAAEGEVRVEAGSSGGDGSATASGWGTVEAANVVFITGVVEPSNTDSNGVVIEQGPVVALYADAWGRTDVVAFKSDGVIAEGGSGNASAETGGTVSAANVIAIGGLVGDLSTGNRGVAINEGPVVATRADAYGSFRATAARNGDEDGDATAAIGAADSLAAFRAANLVVLQGDVSGLAGGEGAALDNIGVVVNGDVLAGGAFGEAGGGAYASGGFYANAARDDGASGAAAASAYGDVVATNSISIAGNVGAADSTLGANSSTGILIGGNVIASDAYADGFADVSARRHDFESDNPAGGDTGSATATVELWVAAGNHVVLGGSVGTNNDFSAGVSIAEGAVAAESAFAEGFAYGQAENGRETVGDSTANSSLTVTAANAVDIDGNVADAGANASVGVVIGEGVSAVNATTNGYVEATAVRDGAGNGDASATASGTFSAVNVISIAGIVGRDIDDDSRGVVIGGAVTASNALAEGGTYAFASRLDAGVGTATAEAVNNAAAQNVVAITGTVGVDTWDAYGVDPQSVTASNATADSTAHAEIASADGNGGTASATATAIAANSVRLIGDVAGDPVNGNVGSTGVLVVEDVSATDASVTGTARLNTSGAGTSGASTITASAANLVEIAGAVGESGTENAGVYIGGNIVLGGLSITLNTDFTVGADSSIVATASGSIANIASIAGSVGPNQTDSDGVYVGGDLLFQGDSIYARSIATAGDGVGTAVHVVEGMNIAAIQGTVGTGSTGSHGVHIAGDIDARNSLVSNIAVIGADATSDGTTRGVWIGGSILTGDAVSSQLDLATAGHNTGAPDPAIDPQQIGDYVELAGSVFIGADGGANLYGVAVGDGDDTVLVRDTRFQMEVTNGFDGGANPEPDGQDVLTFANAQIYVSKIDNFELLNTFNGSMLVLTNPTPYIYAVRDEANVAGSSILAFGDGAAQGIDSLQFDTPMLTIGGIAGIKTPGPGVDDSILKAENNGAGNYEINGDVYNFGTITLSKVLSTVRGTDPDDLTSTGATSFDEPAEQQYWAITGSWALDPTSAAGDRLVINGNYTAGSDIIVDAFVFDTGSASDVVVINGNVAGLTTIWVNNTNAFGPGAATGRGPTDGIMLVDVNNAQDPAAVGAAFVLGNRSVWNVIDPVNHPDPEIQVGAFVYDLVQGGGDGRDFYLQSALLDQVPVYSVMSSAIQQHFYAELGTLYQRMGELRHADTGSKANSSFFEFWARAYGQDVEMNPKSGFDFDMTSKGFMIGGDYAVRNWVKPQSRLHLGGFAGYGWTKLDNVKGSAGDADGKTEGYTVGVYATYFDTAKKGQGLYADFVGKLSFLDSEYTSSTRSTKAKSDDFAWGVSLETGYGIGLGGGFIVQPQGQLSYMRTSKEKFTESSPGLPLEIKRDASESLRGRLGLQLQNTFMLGNSTQFSPYVIGNVLHEFLGDNRTTVAGTEFRNDMGGTWYNAGAGFTLDFDNVGLYGHVEYNFGNRVEGLAAGLGVKVRLGGSSPVVAAPASPPAPPVVPRKNYIVFFDFDRSNITADAQRVIEEAASAAKAGNSARVQLTGHTDRSGSEQYNMALSLRRGEAVKQALIARGIPANTIAIIGRGESQPLVPTADGVREPQNRRVEIVL